MTSMITFIHRLARQLVGLDKLGRAHCAAVCCGLMIMGAQPRQAAAQAPAWADVNESTLVPSGQRYIFPEKYRTLQLDADQWGTSVAQVPKAHASQAGRAGSIILLPMPDGRYERFRIVEDKLMDNQPASIRTFAGQGIDDPTATLRMDWTMWGFHAMILSANYTVYIDPYAQGDARSYLSYFKHDFTNEAKARQQAKCDVGSFGQGRLPQPNVDPAPALVGELPIALRANGTQLRTYRIAVSCTGEYATFHGGTVAGAQAAIATSINRIRGVFEKEVAVSFTLLNQPGLIFTDAATDPFTNTNGVTLLGENQTLVDAVVGNANYDIGHVFSTGGGGVAGLGVVCVTGQKARGVTGLPAPINDPFDIDFVAHEVGHQYAGNHTFNGSSGNCAGGNRSALNAYEPGSGTTIMAYAGICAPQNTQPNSDAYFHVRSYDEILNFTLTGSGNNCPVVTATGNTPPTVTVPAGGFAIPLGTPFVLTGSGSDANADPITYCWEQFDLGPTGPPNSPVDNAPIFRSFNPTTSPSRTFPRIQDIINNTQTLGEILPSYARDLNFRLIVRDNRAGGGGVNYAAIGFTVSQAGPFVVSAPNTAVSWPINSTQSVTWDVANTNGAPVNCANVRLLLSTDGGLTYPTVLIANTPNDGTESVTVPNVGLSTTARVRVEAVGNIFFDISNTNFSITAALPVPSISSFTPASGPEGTVVIITGANLTGATGVSFNNVNAVAFTVNSGTQVTATVPAGGTTGLVRVITPAGTATSATNFTVTPTILSFTPTSGPVGTVVTITGTTFTGATVKSFNNAAASFTVNSATQITATVPAGATTGLLQVTTPAGTAVSATNFVVVPAPTVTSFTPVTGPVGTVVVIAGSDFTGATAVRFNGLNAASFTVNNANQITATVATGTTTGLVSVTTPGGTANSVGNFTIIPAPAISSISPPNGPVGTVVTISGTNLGGATQVQFNGVTASIGTNTLTQITTTVPAGATTGLITVTTSGGNASSASNFAVACIWNGTAWVPVAPTSVDNAIVTAAYNTSTNGNIVCRDLTNNGGTIIEIPTGTVVTVNRVLTNNGTINTQNGGAFVQVEGSTVAQGGLFKAFRDNGYASANAPAYNFWSTPVQNAQISLLTGTLGDFRFSYNEATNQWQGMTSGINLAGSSLRAGVGYSAINGGAITFQGSPNNGNINVSTSRTLTNASFLGFNLMGNPYPSPLLISDGAGGGTGLLEDAANSGFAGSAYVWRDDRLGSGGGAYVAINATSLADPGRTGSNSLINHISVGQGFFVLRTAVGTGNLSFRNLHRLGVVGNTSLFRSEGSEASHLLLSLTGTNGAKDLFQLTRSAGFTDSFDQGADAAKLDRPNGPRLAGSHENGRYQILALPNDGQGLVVPLTVAIEQAGSHTFSAEPLAGGLTTERMFLEDRNTGEFYYLEPNRGHALPLQAGNHPNRFYLRSATEVVGQSATTGARLYSFGDDLFIALNEQRSGQAEIFISDATGALVQRFSTNATKGMARAKASITRSGLYLVKIVMNGEVITARLWIEN